MKMKDKKAEQKSAKQKHFEQLKAQRRKEPNLERPVPELSQKPSILIVCEGKNTEPSYFNQFRITSAKVKSIGEGYNTISLVNRALELSQQGTYDQVWCVFDMDVKRGADEFADFDNAISKALQLGYKIAYSNDAFELWFYLHFNLTESQHLRSFYYKELG